MSVFYETTGQNIVILVDEYDKPIFDNLEDLSVATEMRDILKDFQGSFKPLYRISVCISHRGVKIRKKGIFSVMNNLNDITLDAP